MGASIDFIEHRWGSRRLLRESAELQTADGLSCRVCIENASLSGAFIETRLRLPLLSRVFVRPESAEGGEWLGAFIVRTTDEGVGLEWLEPGLKPITMLLSRPSRRSN
mgnify:CR=1 FL=1